MFQRAPSYSHTNALCLQVFDFVQVVLDVVVRKLIVRQVAGQVLVVGAHVNEPVAGEVEEDDLLFAVFLAGLGLADGGSYGVARFRRGDDAFTLGEERTGIEGFQLLDVNCLHQVVFQKLRHDDTGTVVAQSARVNVGRHEVVAEGEHREERRVARLVAVVVLEVSAGQFRAGCRFGRHVARLAPFLDGVAHEGEADAAEVGAAAEASDDDIGVFAGHFHLFFRLEADDGLVQGDVAHDGAERVFAVWCFARQFHGFRDGRAQRALVVRFARQDVLSCTGGHGGRGCHLCAEGLHDAAAVGFLLITDFHLIDGSFQPEHLGGVGQGCTPLSGTRFGCDVRHPLFFAIVSLCQCGVELVRPDWADAFVLEVDVSRGAECLFQSVGAHQRRAAVVFVHFAHFFGNLYPRVSLVEFLPRHLFRKDGEEVFRFHRLACGRVEQRHGFVHHVGLDVIPIAWDFVFREEVSFSLFHVDMSFDVIFL